MVEITRTLVFVRWLSRLKGQRAVAKILQRIDRLSLGNFGDAKSVGGGVSELRIDYGPGYRLYFTRRQNGKLLFCSVVERRSGSMLILRARRRWLRNGEIFDG